MRLFKRKKSATSAPTLHGEAYYRDLKRRNVVRLFLTYVVPILLLGVYFYFQYQTLARSSQQAHLRAIADNRASTLIDVRFGTTAAGLERICGAAS